MDAHKALINNIFNGLTQVEIPFFQRAYVWNEDLWERFESDLEFVTETNRPHFFGSIILKRGEPPHHGDNFTERWTVVDGQQRLTTFLIFLKVLCLKTDQKLFDMQFRIGAKQIALRPGINDAAAFEQVMRMTEAIEIDNRDPKSRIISAFNYFVKHADPAKLEILTIMQNIEFVRIDLDADEDEQQIFDTINSLGVNLTTSELLKNYFFNRDTIQDYQDKWASVFERDSDTKAYWDTQIDAGHIKRALIDIFFNAYFEQFVQNRKYGVTTEDRQLYGRVQELAQSYQHFIKNYCHGDKNVILNELKEYAELFRKIFNPDYCNMAIPREPGIERLNVIIFGLKNTTPIPYILYITKNVSDPEELNRMYSVLESYIMRRIVVHATTKNYNNIFTYLIRDEILDANTLVQRLANNQEASTYIPSDEDLENGFRHSRLVNLQSKGVLYLLESSIRPANSATVLDGFNNYSLEHLMPKKWRNNWSSDLNEDQAEKRDANLLTLGNLAIIPQALNSSIRDGNWMKKKEGKGNKPGLYKCANGLVTVQDALKKDEWTDEDIVERGQWLAKEAERIWKL